MRPLLPTTPPLRSADMCPVLGHPPLQTQSFAASLQFMWPLHLGSCCSPSWHPSPGSMISQSYPSFKAQLKGPLQLEAFLLGPRQPEISLSLPLLTFTAPATYSAQFGTYSDIVSCFVSTSHLLATFYAPGVKRGVYIGFVSLSRLAQCHLCPESASHKYL